MEAAEIEINMKDILSGRNRWPTRLKDLRK